MKELYEALLKLETGGGRGLLVTVVEKEGHGPAVAGSKMLVMPKGMRTGTVGGGALEHAAIDHAEKLLNEGVSNHDRSNRTGGIKKYLMSPDNELLEGEQTGMLCGGSITLFYELIGPEINVFIMGAGHVGQALGRHMETLGYFITVVDTRKALVDSFQWAHRRVVVSNYETALDDFDIPPQAFFVIATHSHALDYVALKRVYKADWHPKYVGLIASKRKAPLMIKQLKSDLGDDIDLSTLYSPIGLKIGGTTPDEIAISIIAELQAVRYDKEGNRHMKDLTSTPH